jgi:hypothetical protein
MGTAGEVGRAGYTHAGSCITRRDVESVFTKDDLLI